MGWCKTSRVSLVAAVLVLSELPSGDALAANATTSIAVDISSQPLAMALVELCRQGNLQLVISAGTLPGKTILAMRGNMALGTALDTLLRDTGLTYRFAGEHTIAIVRLEAPGGAAAIPLSNTARAGDAPLGQPGDTEEPAARRGRRSGDEATARHRGLVSRIAARLGLCVDAAGERTACDTRQSATSMPAALTEVVVTGSRVITNGNDSPNPVTVVSTEELLAVHPNLIFEAMLDLPQFGGSRGVTASNPGGAGGANSQVNAYNQRGMGPVRTLVLYDGHRLPPTQQNYFVDANTVPQMLLQRVDVVTGGTSAVYGSDAISGVVNFITDRTFVGVKATAQAGLSDFGDEPSSELGLAFGTRLFGGRGHFEGSYLRHYDAGILHRATRPQFAPRWVILNDGLTPATAYYLARDATASTLPFGGKILGPASNPLASQQFVVNGVLGPFVNGASAGNAGGNTQIGGDGGYNTDFTLKSRTELNQLYGRFDFDFSDSLHGYASAAVTRDWAFSYTNNNRLNNITLSTSDAFLPAAYRQQLLAANLATFTFGKMWPTSVVPATNADFYVHHDYFNAGLEGRRGAYRWEASFTHVDAKLDSRNNANIDNGHLFAALDAVTDAGGQIVCSVTLTNPGLYPGCVPLNVFGPSSESAAAVNYILAKSYYLTRLPSDDLAASIAGAPFRNWAGPVNMALAGEWRRQGLRVDSTALPAMYDPLNCVGLRSYNCILPGVSSFGSSRWSSSVAPRPEVTANVGELALEADLPLLSGRRLARKVDLNTAYRHARYAFQGNPVVGAPAFGRHIDANSWKLGLDWHFDDAVTLRATHSRDIRAPNLTDLYQPAGFNFNVQNLDLLTGIVPPAASIQGGGNPDLKPEIAATTTVGLVFKPSDGFSLAVDAFRISVRDAIQQVNGTEPYAQRNCYAGSSFFCALQERPFPITNTSPANAVTRWYNRPVNVAELWTQGLDIEANYRVNLAGRSVSLRAYASYQPHVLLLIPGAVTTDYAATTGAAGANQAGPRVRITVQAHYPLSDRMSIDWQTRWRDALRHNPNSVFYSRPEVDPPAVAYSNLNLTYRLRLAAGGHADVFFNVQNLFNQPAPVTSVAGVQADPGIFGGYAPGDDPTGRYYTLGVRYRL